MKKSIIFALVAALPVFAQDEAPALAPAPQQPACQCARPHHHGPHAKWSHDGCQKKFLEKFDANKDGQLDDQEKEAVKAAFEARRAECGKRGHEGRRHHGPRGPHGHGAPEMGGPRSPHCGCAPCGSRPMGPRNGGLCQKKFLEKFDANKDGQLDDQEKEAVKAAFEARRAECQKKFLEKFDANKDGQLDDQEKEAMKAAFEARKAECPKRGPEGRRHHGPKGPHCHGAPEMGGPRGPHCGCAPCGPRPMGPRNGGLCQKKFLEKFDANKDGQLDDQEKEAVKAAFEARKAECRKKFLEKFDANKDGQLDDQEKEAMKAAFEARKAECGKRGHEGRRHHGPRSPHGHGAPEMGDPRGPHCGCAPCGDQAPKPAEPAPEAPAPQAPAAA